MNSDRNPLANDVQVTSEVITRKGLELDFRVYERTEQEEWQELAGLCEKMKGTDLLDRYRDSGKEWEPDVCLGYTTLPVLQRLWGKKLDNSLLAYLHAVRPSQVRISDGWVASNAVPWRVTVFVEKQGDVEVITHIEQEVCIGFSSGQNVEQVFRHLHEDDASLLQPASHVLGHLQALSKADFR